MMRGRFGRTGSTAAAAVTALVAAALLSACSGGDEVNGGTPTPTTAAAPTASATAAAASATAASGGTGTSPAGTPRCTAGELALSLGPGEGAAGSVYRPIIFTNTGTRTCELTGFPGVSYVAGDDGHQVGPAAVESGPRGGEIKMAPKGTSVAQVQFVQVANFDAAVCQPTAVRGLRVYPPGETASMFIAMDGTGCAGNPPGQQLSVKTITAS